MYSASIKRYMLVTFAEIGRTRYNFWIISNDAKESRIIQWTKKYLRFWNFPKSKRCWRSTPLPNLRPAGHGCKGKKIWVPGDTGGWAGSFGFPVQSAFPLAESQSGDSPLYSLGYGTVWQRESGTRENPQEDQRHAGQDTKPDAFLYQREIPKLSDRHFH